MLEVDLLASWMGKFTEEYDYLVEDMIPVLEEERAKRGRKPVNQWNAAILGVGTGYGCVVEGTYGRCIVTAAHCLPQLPSCNDNTFDGKACYPALLGPPGDLKSAAAACYYADPIFDIAVLGPPSRNGSPKEFDQYRKLTDIATPLSIAEPPPVSIVWIPSPNGEWLSYVAISTCREKLVMLGLDQSLAEMGGAPIVSDSGTAIGVLCPDLMRGAHTELVGALPRRLRILGGAAPSMPF